MTRLSKNTRDLMVNKIMRHTYAARAEELVAEGQALFDKAYAFMYSKEERAAMDALLALEADALPTATEIKVNAGLVTYLHQNPTVVVRIRGNSCLMLAQGKRGKDGVPVMYRDTRYGNRVDVPDGDKRNPELHEAIRAYLTAGEKFRDEAMQAYHELTAALERFGTVKKLREGWPDVLPLVEDLLPVESKSALPAVQVKALNDKFRLPPEKEAA